MRTYHSNRPEPSLEGSYDPRLLDRLGRELVHVYEDTLRDALPDRLRCLVEQLERAVDSAPPGSSK